MFSTFERLSLLNQFLLLEKLDPKGGWDRLATILREGYTSEYRSITDVLDPELPEERCRFVMDVLAMHDAIQRPFVKAPAEPLPSEMAFNGFDGNNETALMSFARYLLHVENRWSYLELGGIGDLNSHFPTIDMYRRMLRKWDDLGRPHEATKEQAKAIIAERVHPENR